MARWLPVLPLLVLVAGCVSTQPESARALVAFSDRVGLDTPDPDANLWAHDAREGLVRSATERAASPYQLLAHLDADVVVDIAAIRVRGDSAFVVTCFSALGFACGADPLPVPRQETQYRLVDGATWERPRAVLVQKCGGISTLIYPLWPRGYERYGTIDSIPPPKVVGPDSTPEEIRYARSRCWM